MIVLFDDNGITIDGRLSLSDSVDQVKRFEAAGWRAERIDGHDPEAIAAAHRARAEFRSSVADRLQDHDRFRRAEQSRQREVARLAARRRRDRGRAQKARLGLSGLRGAGRHPRTVAQAGQRSKDARKAWDKRLGALDAATSAPNSSAACRGELPKAKLAAAVKSVKETLAATPKDIATRSSSEFALEVARRSRAGNDRRLGRPHRLQQHAHQGDEGDVAERLRRRFIHYGIREHGMAAAMNGMALHGGIIPYSGTFLVFSDYCRPAIRLAALMGERVIHVMTHDSIGLGEDGPTHQPVEHLAALRAIPNLLVFRPCDAVETLECWQLALQVRKTARACWR